jgi:hypothetical protein
MANQQINTEELQAVNNEILVRGIIEKTKSPGLTWDMLSPTTFQATVNDAGTIWDFCLTKTKATGSNSEALQFTLDILKDASLHKTIKEKNAPTNAGTTETTRSTRVEELFITVERVTLEAEENKLKEANQLIFNLPDCRP